MFSAKQMKRKQLAKTFQYLGTANSQHRDGFLITYSRLQLRWFRPKPGARRLLGFARAESRESRPISTSQDWFQPLQAFINRNFPAGRGSRIRNLLHQTLSLLTDKDRRTDCWIRRKQNMIRNNPDKSEFSNLLHCVLCTRLLILKAHVPSKKVNLRARWREIYCKMYLRTKRSSIAVVVYLLFY